MRVFKVGGCIRDRLLGLEPKDVDILVVGATPEDLLSRGFEEVGKDFGVFLHPETGDEWALARRERSTGEAHTDFEMEVDGVTFEEDLSRRDLTINAMAVEVDPKTLEELTGEIIDPFGGQKDLEDKVLRHVTSAFAEDPLRVLRVARFLARFGEGWIVAWETVDFCSTLVFEGKLESLAPERVWSEVSRALMESHPQMFFEFLCAMEWDGVDELSALKVVEQRPDFHPEGDAFIHTMLCLRASVGLGLTLPERFSVLVHDLGKRPAFDFNRSLGKSHLGGHEVFGLPLVEGLCERWKVPNDCKSLALKACRNHTNVHNIHKMKPAKIVDMLTRVDAFRNPEVVDSLGRIGQCDAWGRTEKFHGKPYPQRGLLGLFLYAANRASFKHVKHNSKKPLDTGEKIKEAMRRERGRQVSLMKKSCEHIIEGIDR